MGIDTPSGTAPGGPDRDCNDFRRLRHARDQHLGFPVGRFLQPPPMLFTRDGNSVFLGDMYRGHAAFLVCAGPSLKTHDLTQLQQRGMLTCAVNNAAAVFRPQLWTGVDDPGNFCDAIWYDPGITKFVPLCHMEKTFLVRDEQDRLVPSTHRVGDMPAVFGFRRNEAFAAEQWLYEDTFNWGNHSERIDAYGHKGSRSVMYVALRLLFYLGVRRVYLLGCDFRMEHGQENYAFEQDRTRGSVRNNNSSFQILNVRLQHLKPYFEREGFEVFNCTPNSGLTVFPHVPFEEAVTRVRDIIPTTILTAGMYDFKQRQREAANMRQPAPDIMKPAPPAHAAAVNAPAAAARVMPELTLITAMDERAALKLRYTWPTWMRFKPWLKQVPVLVIHDRRLDPQTAAFGWLREHPQIQFVPWTTEGTAEGRDPFLTAFLRVPAECVRTPWYLKLDADTLASNDRPWLLPEWLAPDAAGRHPAYVGHAWGYTKPADAIARLDDWGDSVPGLRDSPRLDLPYDPQQPLIRHPTINSFCFLGSTAWTREVLAYLGDEPPCRSHGTYVWYCAARRRDPIVRVNMKQHGWESLRRLHPLRGRCEELLAGAGGKSA